MYNRKIWSPRVLIPLWVAHITGLFLLIMVLAVSMMEVAGENDKGSAPPVLAAFMSFFAIALVMSPIEMVFQAYYLLEPWLYLVFQVYKVIFATVFAVVEIIGFFRMDWSTYKNWYRTLMIVQLVLCILTVISFFCSLIYGSIVMHRHRKGSLDYEYASTRREKDGGE